MDSEKPITDRDILFEIAKIDTEEWIQLQHHLFRLHRSGNRMATVMLAFGEKLGDLFEKVARLEGSIGGADLK